MGRPKDGKQTVRVSASLDRATLSKLSQRARELDVSVAWVVRHAITDYLAKGESDSPPELPLTRSNR
jgi:predicted transcriptional regulator